MAENNESAAQRAIRLYREAEAAKGEAIQELLNQREEITRQLRELGHEDEAPARQKRTRRTKAEMEATRASAGTSGGESSAGGKKPRGRPRKNASA